MDTELQPGLVGHTSITVDEANTAAALGSGLVRVFATPALVTLLETAAVDAVAGWLEEGMTTVGTHVDVHHLAATPVGMAVHAEATLLEVDGRSLTFRVAAHDECEPVAEGTHCRFIVNRERFLQRALAKAGPLT